jgi:hypothetical protein
VLEAEAARADEPDPFAEPAEPVAADEDPWGPPPEPAESVFGSTADDPDAPAAEASTDWSASEDAWADTPPPPPPPPPGLDVDEAAWADAPPPPPPPPPDFEAPDAAPAGATFGGLSGPAPVVPSLDDAEGDNPWLADLDQDEPTSGRSRFGRRR